LLLKIGGFHFVFVESVNILQVASQVPALSKSLFAVRALKRPLSRMFSEMVSQITGFLEDTPAPVDHTLKVEFNPLSARISYSQSFVPVVWDSIEGL